MQVIRDLFSAEQLAHLTSLPEMKSGKVQFSVPLRDDIKQTLSAAFGLDLSGRETIPCRYMKGDTAAHIDQSATDFENTYLVYLTDGEGEFVIGDGTYAIEANTAFRFSEGIRHEVKGSCGTGRLMIGPMSEHGMPVGAPPSGIVADGATDVVYIKYDNIDGLQYRINTGGYSILSSTPYTVTNTNPTSSSILQVIFETNIVIDGNTQYFVPLSEYIQFGSTALNVGGSVPTITISGVSDYPGFIQNGTNSSTGYSYIYVLNLFVYSNGSQLAVDGGWIGQSYFGNGATFNCIINCSSSGEINEGCGGIIAVSYTHLRAHETG
jgi:hypothetical protein